MKKWMITMLVCFLGWEAMAMAGGNRTKNVEDLGKGLQKVTWYYDNGKVAEEGFYLEGQKHGTWATFSEEGVKTCVATWNRDKKDGDCLILHENGKVKYQVIYSNNKKIKAYEWDETGLLIAAN